MKVITFSRYFPATHPKKGIDTFFPEQILNGLGIKSPHDVCEAFQPFVNDFAIMEGSKKYHTIRAGNRWKVGDWFSPRVWSGKPYASKQIEFAPPVQIKKVWPVEIEKSGMYMDITIQGEINGYRSLLPLCEVAKNDGLDCTDFQNWFSKLPFFGQIICWNENIEYF